MSKNKRIFIGILVLSLILLGITFFSFNKTKGQDLQKIEKVDNMSENSQKQIKTISTVYELKNRLDQKNPQEILLDVRTPEEFNLEHIPGAINLDVENPNFEKEVEKLDKNKTYIVFCRSGNRAFFASEIMTKKNFQVLYSKEGITAWKLAGFDLVKNSY